MATKTQDTINALANGIINYINVMVSNAPFVLTDLGKVKAVTLTNGKYLHTVTIRNFDYVGIKSMGNNEFPVGSVVYILVPNRQYNQMFILGHCDDTNANIKGGNINLGNGNFVVDNSGNVTIKTGSINIGSGNFAVDNTGKVTIKSGSINIGSGNFTVDANGKMTAKSGYIGDSSNGFTIGNTYIYNGMTSLSDTSHNGIYLGTDGIALGKGNFKVTNGGVLTAKSGYIGNGSSGFTIGNTAIYNGMTSRDDTSHNGIWLGTDGIALGKGNFKVTNGGVLTAKSGYIGNWEIGQYGITNKVLQSGTNYWNMFVGADTFSSIACEFKIEAQGGADLSIKGRKLTLNATNNRIDLSNGYFVTSSQDLEFYASNEANYGVKLGVTDSAWAFSPVVDGYLRLGSPNHKWTTVYAQSGTINTSDRNEKKDIKTLDDDLSRDFLMSLNPVSYKFINGESGRTHYGFIAQDVEDTLNNLGLTAMDFAGFCKDQKTRDVETVRYTEDGYEIIDEYGNVETNIHQEPIPNEYSYGLRYEEFIPLCVKMIQMQQLRIEELERKVSNGN